MWVLTDEGMYSAVQDKRDPTTIVVRARVKADLEALRKRVPGASKVITNEGTDYPCRVRMSRADWARFCAGAAVDVDYTNFKDSVTAKQGKRRHDVYLRVWGVLDSLTPRRERAAMNRRWRDDRPLFRDEPREVDADPGLDAWWPQDA